MSDFNVSVLDNEYEGILWLKLQRTDDEDDCFCICVCYLPPEYSTRAVNVNEVFDTLLVNFCMLNGRNYVKNDFTCFTSQGQCVVDYCLVGWI